MDFRKLLLSKQLALDPFVIHATNKAIPRHFGKLVPVLALKGELSQGGDVTCNRLSLRTNSRVEMKSLHNRTRFGIVVRF